MYTYVYIYIFFFHEGICPYIGLASPKAQVPGPEVYGLGICEAYEVVQTVLRRVEGPRP